MLQAPVPDVWRQLVQECKASSTLMKLLRREMQAMQLAEKAAAAGGCHGCFLGPCGSFYRHWGSMGCSCTAQRLAEAGYPLSCGVMRPACAALRVEQVNFTLCLLVAGCAWWLLL